MSSNAFIADPIDQASSADAQVLDAIQCFLEYGHLSLVCEDSGSATIELRTGETVARWPIRSPPVRSFLATFFYRITGQTATRPQLQQIVEVLEGLAVTPALSQPARGYEELAIQDPLISVLLQYVDAETTTELATSLFNKLTSLAHKTGWLPACRAQWPANSNKMSGRLKQLEDVLRYHRLSFTRRHTRRGSEITLTPRDPTSVPASPVPSRSNPLGEADLSCHDGRDAALDGIVARFPDVFLDN